MQECTESWPAEPAFLLEELLEWSAGILNFKSDASVWLGDAKDSARWTREGQDARWEIKSMNSAGPAFAPKRILNILKNGWIGFPGCLAFLKLLEKVVLVLICLDSATEPLSSMELMDWSTAFFWFYSVFGR